MANQKRLDKSFSQRLNEIIEANLSNERFGVSELAYEMNMSRSNLHRKVRSAYGTSISLYIRQLRLNKAMELLKDTDTGVAEVAYHVGFGSPTYFSKCFLEKFGFPPSEIKKQKGDRISAEPDSVPSQDQTPNRGKALLTWMIAGLAAILVIVVLITILKPFSNLGHSENISIMVMPFHNDSPGRRG